MTELEIICEDVKRGDPWSPEEVAELDRMIATGCDCNDIAQALGRSYWSVKAKRNRLTQIAKQGFGTRYCPQVAPAAQRVARHFDIRLADMRGPTNFRKWCWPRQIAMWVAVQAGCTFSATGRYFRRDHTTTMHALRKIEQRRAESETDRWLTDTLLAEALQNAPLPPPAAVLESGSPTPPEIEMPASDVHGAIETPFYDRQVGNSRAFLVRQNERFLAALAAAGERP